MQFDLYQKLLEGLNETQMMDIHTHLDASHLPARGLHDVLLYHMVISDLVSAGCPSPARLSEDPDETEIENRIVEALPYLSRIQNTALFWGVRIILKELYNWEAPLTTHNWRKLDGIIRERSRDPGWAVAVLDRANIQRSCTELWRRGEGNQDHLLQYALEWAFFTRSQRGVNDMPLYELERTWNQPGPSAPLPVTSESKRPHLERSIRTLEDVHVAITHYVDHIPYQEILSTAQHISTDIHYRWINQDEMSAALVRRHEADQADRDIYASYVLEAFLSALELRPEHIVYQFSIGAEPLAYETGSKLHQETIFELAEVFERHPRLHFQAFLSSEHANQALCTLARELPNLSLAGYWWHNFFPGIMRKIIHDRLDMLAINKQVGFFSDAYCMDWAYAKAALVRRQWAEVLAEKVQQGQYNIAEALALARESMFETPHSLLGMLPRNGRQIP